MLPRCQLQRPLTQFSWKDGLEVTRPVGRHVLVDASRLQKMIDFCVCVWWKEYFVCAFRIKFSWSCALGLKRACRRYLSPIYLLLCCLCCIICPDLLLSPIVHGKHEALGPFAEYRTEITSQDTFDLSGLRTRLRFHHSGSYTWQHA